MSTTRERPVQYHDSATSLDAVRIKRPGELLLRRDGGYEEKTVFTRSQIYSILRSMSPEEFNEFISLNALSDEEVEIIRLRSREGLGMVKTARRLGLNRWLVQRREMKAFEKLGVLPSGDDVGGYQEKLRRMSEDQLDVLLERGLGILSQRQSDVLRLRYWGDGVSLLKAGRRLSISESSVHHHEHNAIRRIVASKRLREYVENLPFEDGMAPKLKAPDGPTASKTQNQMMVDALSLMSVEDRERILRESPYYAGDERVREAFRLNLGPDILSLADIGKKHKLVGSSIWYLMTKVLAELQKRPEVVGELNTVLQRSKNPPLSAEDAKWTLRNITDEDYNGIIRELPQPVNGKVDYRRILTLHLRDGIELPRIDEMLCYSSMAVKALNFGMNKILERPFLSQRLSQLSAELREQQPVSAIDVRYVLKRVRPEEMLWFIQQVPLLRYTTGKDGVEPDRNRKLMEEYIIRGKGVPEIAEDFGLKLNTAEQALMNSFRNLGQQPVAAARISSHLRRWSKVPKLTPLQVRSALYDVPEDSRSAAFDVLSGLYPNGERNKGIGMLIFSMKSGVGDRLSFDGYDRAASEHPEFGLKGGGIRGLVADMCRRMSKEPAALMILDEHLRPKRISEAADLCRRYNGLKNVPEEELLRHDMDRMAVLRDIVNDSGKVTAKSLQEPGPRKILAALAERKGVSGVEPLVEEIPEKKLKALFASI